MKIVAGTLAAAALLAVASQSPAAVVVLGNNLARNCYLSAEYPAHPATGLIDCNKALAGPVAINDRAATLVNRGILRALLSDTSGAISDYDEAIALDATLADAYLDRSAAMITLKRFIDALHDANRALELNVRRKEIAYYNRAIANEALGNVQGAYDDFHAALQIEPKFAAAAEQLTRFRKVTASPGGS